MELQFVKSAERTRAKKSRPCSSATLSTTPSPRAAPNNFPTSLGWQRDEWDDSESSDRLSQSVTSSTSWSDEMEGEMTKKVQDQWRLFENTLYRDGADQLSAGHPLREECRLWNQHSPHLRIVGHAIKPSVGCQTRSPLEEAEEQIEEIIAAHGDYEEKTPSKTVDKPEPEDDPGPDEAYKEKIKRAVIDQLFARIWPEVVSRIGPALQQRAGEPRDTSEVGKCESPQDGLTGGFNSLTIGDDLSPASLRTMSGRRSGQRARQNVAAVPIRPVLLECPSAAPSAGSAVRRSPGRLTHLRHPRPHPSPERLLSPLAALGEMRPAAKSAGRRGRPAERREGRPRPQYDPMTGRVIASEESRWNRSGHFGHGRNYSAKPF